MDFELKTLDLDGVGDMPLASPKASASEGSWGPLGGAAGTSASVRGSDARRSTRGASAATSP